MSPSLSIVIIAKNEEANIGRALESVQPLVKDAGESVVVDSGSTDRTVELARSYGAKVFVEEWKGYSRQWNSAIDKATCDWVFPLASDEALEPGLVEEIRAAIAGSSGVQGYFVQRKNFFLGRWMRHGGFYPDPHLRLFRRGQGRFEDRPVHETVKVSGPTAHLQGAILHHAYPTLEIYLEHMRRYAELGAEMVKNKPRAWLWLNRWLNPPLTFFYNYVVRLGFLDGHEGFLLHWNHRRYVGWKYQKAWELKSRNF